MSSQPEGEGFTPTDAKMDNWHIRGRISILSLQENWYAKFNWIQKNKNFQLSFTGPLGETELQVSQIAQDIYLKTAAKELRGDNLELLLKQETGWSFPVTSLRYWIQGEPNPDVNSKLTYNESQQISDIFQSGWHIQYKKRFVVEANSGSQGEFAKTLPKKITATRENLKIKLIISHWNFDDIELITPK